MRQDFHKSSPASSDQLIQPFSFAYSVNLRIQSMPAELQCANCRIGGDRGGISSCQIGPGRYVPFRRRFGVSRSRWAFLQSRSCSGWYVSGNCNPFPTRAGRNLPNIFRGTQQSRLKGGMPRNANARSHWARRSRSMIPFLRKQRHSRCLKPSSPVP